MERKPPSSKPAAGDAGDGSGTPRSDQLAAGGPAAVDHQAGAGGVHWLDTPRSDPSDDPALAAGERPVDRWRRRLLKLLQRLRLRHLLFACLMLSGIIPLAITSILLIRQNRTLLVDQEEEHLVRSAQSVSVRLNSQLEGLAGELRTRGQGLLLAADLRPDGPLWETLGQDNFGPFLIRLRSEHSDMLALQALDPEQRGPVIGSKDIGPLAEEALARDYEKAHDRGSTIYNLVVEEENNRPQLLISVPVFDTTGQQRMVLQSAVQLRPREVLFGGESDGTLLLVDGSGQVLWAEEKVAGMVQAVAESELVSDFQASPMLLTQRFDAALDGERSVQATLSPVEASGWGAVVAKPVTAAFPQVSRMIYSTLLLCLLLVTLAAIFAAAVARWVGRPINRLAATSHEIAAGNFGRRVELTGLVFEMSDLGRDFNAMCGHVESYVERLKHAAQANQRLFIGSIRAFAAAIDAKDPYTRGHSERVAAVSRTTARLMGLDAEMQQRVWLAALLHDVGKIGVEDRILKKRELLTDEEYEQMKLHTIIGAEIMERIAQLKEMVPGIRWHHEAWNGRGYPDGLRGEQIPLIARIVAVADTFDAVTTSRPYQEAYTLDFAVETITKLTGSRFDAKVVTAFLKGVRNGEIEVGERPQPDDAEGEQLGADPTVAAAVGAVP